MKVITENKTPGGISYDIDENGSKTVVNVTCSTVSCDGVDVVVFHDASMKILYAPSVFIQKNTAWDSENSRLQAISALKILYSFSGIIGLPPEEFDETLCKAFVQFARGTLETGVSAEYRLSTMRAESTINSYLRTVRKLMEDLGANASPFLRKKRTIGGRRSSRTSSGSFVIKPDLVTPLEAPTAVTVLEFKELLQHVESKPDNPARPMIRLMFEHGLRLGETLGLTLEDLSLCPSRAGKPRYLIRIRNRVSDRADQRAKTAMKTPNSSFYKTSKYTTRGEGYQEVYISESLYFEICEYIEMAHSPFVDGDPLSCPCKADSVVWEQGNRYIFLNTKGGPLSANLWGKRLRKIFSDAGIPVDEGVKRTNLSHRFRHGYAMFLIRTRKLDALSVKTLMRHRSLHSIDPYNKPTIEDIYEMQKTTMMDMETALFGGDENRA